MKNEKCYKEGCTGTYEEDSVMSDMYGEYKCNKCGHMNFRWSEKPIDRWDEDKASWECGESVYE